MDSEFTVADAEPLLESIFLLRDRCH